MVTHLQIDDEKTLYNKQTKKHETSHTQTKIEPFYLEINIIISENVCIVPMIYYYLYFYLIIVFFSIKKCKTILIENR